MKEIQAKGILSAHNGMNLYRGCTHGCIYCDARSTVYHTPVPFEDVEIKVNAPELLEEALSRKRKKCMIGTGSMSDPYMHCEEKIQLTRRCLEIIDRRGFGLAIQTKSNRILRDLDLLDSINRKSKCVVQMTLTTFDENLCRILEPNVCTTKERYETLKILQQHGIPTVVWITPILPFINDSVENLQGLLDYCADAGVKGIIDFGMGLTLREGDREYYYAALDKHFPGLKQQYLKKYGWNAYELPSPNRNQLLKLFNNFCTTHSIMKNPDEIFKYMSEFPQKEEPQQMLFNFD